MARAHGARPFRWNLWAAPNTPRYRPGSARWHHGGSVSFQSPSKGGRPAAGVAAERKVGTGALNAPHRPRAECMDFIVPGRAFARSTSTYAKLVPLVNGSLCAYCTQVES